MTHDPVLDQYLDLANHPRGLGHVPPPPDYSVAGTMAATVEIPESDWQPFELEGCPHVVKDQDGRGACNGFAAATVMEWARWIAGMPHVELSGWFVYAILCNGIDRGSNIGEALTLLSKTGTCPEDMVEYGTINPRRLSDRARASAGRFRIEVGERLTTWRQMVTATLLRRPFNFSIRVGNALGRSWDRLDDEGCPPVAPGPGNHAVCGGLGLKRGKDGRWRIKWVNSWTKGFGVQGYAWVSEEHIARQSYFEAYSVSAVYDDPDDATRPPAPIA